jgi:hypothetical protein
MAMREYNTYDKYGLLQGLLDALGKHTNAIPLQVRVELAESVIDALPEDPEDILIEEVHIKAPTQHERFKQQAAQREATKPTALPKLSPLGALIAH